MNRLPPIERVSDLRLGDHPAFDAWFYSFCAENTPVVGTEGVFNAYGNIRFAHGKNRFAM